MTQPTPQAQHVPNNLDRMRADCVVARWLRGTGRGAVAVQSNAAHDLSEQIAVAIAEGRHDELVAEQGDGPIELEVDERDAARDVLRRAAELAPRELETAALHHADGDVLRFCRLDEVVDWLQGAAVRAAEGSL